VTLLAPAFLLAAVAAALAVVALHFIVMRQPPQDVLPTARFIPMRPALVRTVNKVPEDILLLVLRTLAILGVGAAFARPVWRPGHIPIVHVVVADRSRAIARASEVGDSARRLLSNANDALVIFDSTAHQVVRQPADSLAHLTRAPARGALSAALVVALRTAARLRDRADSLDITLISPAEVEELDAATDSIRAEWPGAIRLVRVASDGAPSMARATVTWPTRDGLPGASVRIPTDTATAITAGAAVVVAPFARRWRLDTTDAQVIARWVDGEPAVVERRATSACTRSVAVSLPAAGDLVLRPEFRRFAAALGLPCGAFGRDTTPAPWPVDHARPRRVSARMLAGVSMASTPLTLWLLGFALAALVAELFVRR